MPSFKSLLAGKFGQDVLWNMGSLVLLALGGVMINSIIIRFRGDRALGIFNQVYAIYIVLSQIGVGGLQFSALKHISHHQDDRALCADITTSALLLVTAVTIPMILLCTLLVPPIGHLLDSPGVERGLFLVLPGLLFFALNKVLVNVLNGLQYMKVYALFRSLRFVLIPAALCLMVFGNAPDEDLSFSLTAAEFVLFIGMLVYVYGRLLPLQRIAQARERFKEHISFGVRGVLSGVLIELNTRVDVLLLGYFLSDAQVGIYSFAALLAEGAAQFPLAIRWNVDPIIGRYFAEGQQARIAELSHRIRRVFYPIMGAVGVLAIGFYPLFLWLWLPHDPILTNWSIFAIIMIGVIINAGYRPMTGVFLQGGRPGTNTLFIVSLIVANVLLNLFLIPLWGIHGAALVAMLTYIFEAAGLVFYSRRLFGLKL